MPSRLFNALFKAFSSARGANSPQILNYKILRRSELAFLSAADFIFILSRAVRVPFVHSCFISIGVAAFAFIIFLSRQNN
ncbi:MAG: hypothetical protein IJ576_07630, partial [Synergistaceae bacterium]|nr:hypothetical protein [Synergistaceae bacterium]